MYTTNHLLFFPLSGITVSGHLLQTSFLAPTHGEFNQKREREREQRHQNITENVPRFCDFFPSPTHRRNNGKQFSLYVSAIKATIGYNRRLVLPI
uniref:Uncharacterized protein n=1 Tax=Rhizophora mucronata TaxID=61149 RepID=A0A2P2L5I6_RHIMU